MGRVTVYAVTAIGPERPMVPLLSDAVISKALPAAMVVSAFRAMLEPAFVLPMATEDAAVLAVPILTVAVPVVTALAMLTTASPSVTVLAILIVSSLPIPAAPMLTTLVEVEPMFVSTEFRVIPAVLPAFKVMVESSAVLPMITEVTPVVVVPVPILTVAVPEVTALAMLTTASPSVTVLAILIVSSLPISAPPMLMLSGPEQPSDWPKLGQEVVGLNGLTQVSADVEEAPST